MKYVLDIECNALERPDRIWLVVLKCIETGEYFKYYDLTKKKEERERFIRDFQIFRQDPNILIGHNLLGYDYPILCSVLEMDTPDILGNVIDTLIISKLVDYSRDGHSIEDYGLEFGFEKIKYNDFSKFTPEMETYCVRDVDICHKIYSKYSRYINNPDHRSSIDLEQWFQLVVNNLHDNGFCFNSARASSLLQKVELELSILDKDILDAFPPRLRLLREITPKETKFGTLNRSDFRWVGDGNLSEYNGGPFCRCSWSEFNPSSHKQIIQVLNEAGWKPVDKTKTHIDAIRTKDKDKLKDLEKTGWKVNEQNLDTLPTNAPKGARLLVKRIIYEARRRTLTEWLSLVCTEIKIENASIDVLGRAIKDQLIQSGVPRNSNIIEKDLEKEILKSLDVLCYKNLDITNKKNANVDTILEIPTIFLLKTLIKWLKTKKVNVEFVKEEDGWSSITVIPQEKSEDCFASDAMFALDGLKQRGLKFSITSERIKGRFYGIGAWTHRMAHQNPNTANIPNDLDTSGKKKLLGKELRSLWCAPRNRLLVGCDAEGIQLRIFAHYINDPEFTDALVKGRKDDKTDPHSLNQRILGDVCKSRAAAKRFIYALLLGAGLSKLTEILGCSPAETQQALDRLLIRYTGWATLKEEVFPKDARRGWFVGLDGRKVRIPGDTEGSRRHLAMSGYLQNGEAVCMKMATRYFFSLLSSYDAKLVNFVHDEWQVECGKSLDKAVELGHIMADSLRKVGEDLKLNCPLAGSFYNDDLKDYTIGTNWSVTH